jgi:methylglutaconyl-CoA hydratase
MSDLVKVTRRGPATVLALNRPDKRNALSRGLITALDESFAAAVEDPKSRVIVITGEGPAFCAGMDLTELQATVRAEAEVIWDDARRLAVMFDRIYRSPKPTVAVVNGPAVAGGAGIASVCDIAIAASGAKFGYPEVRRGLVAALVMPHLLRHVGERMARHLLLVGDLIDAEPAQRCGLINECVAADRLWPRADELITALAAGGPKALKTTKDLLMHFSSQALSTEEAARASAEPRLTEECQFGLDAFFAKQDPPWLRN